MTHINLERLVNSLSTAYKTHISDGRTEYACGILLAKDIAINEPKVDAVEVVRCKNCAYADLDGTTCHYWMGHFTKPDRYCSEGERRESEVEAE